MSNLITIEKLEAIESKELAQIFVSFSYQKKDYLMQNVKKASFYIHNSMLLHSMYLVEIPAYSSPSKILLISRTEDGEGIQKENIKMFYKMPNAKYYFSSNNISLIKYYRNITKAEFGQYRLQMQDKFRVSRKGTFGYKQSTANVVARGGTS